jgi:long-chain fatty acid transport protein
MKKVINLIVLFFASIAIGQTGHLMQGVGAVNMSMGGASTAQPIDINGAMQWNPASISTFDNKIMNFDLGLFFAAPELSSTLPAGAMGAGTPATSGTTQDDLGVSPLPAFGMVWGNPESKHTFGLSIFGVSGFGVDFAEETNTPALGASWDPNNSNVINYPQNMNGFGHVTSNYMLLQIGTTWAYELSDKFSIGIEPTLDYATLELGPNPLANPDPAKGYPVADKATAMGFGAQFGLFFDSGKGFKAGMSYKTNQKMKEFDFKNTYLDGSAAPNNQFEMDFPAILSFGIGYSNDAIDFAMDYRMVNYEKTAGFEAKGWTSTASVSGFGWKNMNILSMGLQYKGFEKMPIRLGYTYSSNPIDEDLAFFSVSAPAVVKNAFQLGLGYEISNKINLNMVYHHGSSGDATKGNLLNPMMVSATNPYGAIPGTSVSYKMSTDLIMVGISYTLK